MATSAYPGGDLYIVDDDASTRDALSVIFTLAGYRITCFPDGEAFLAVARQNPPVCVMLDVHMPKRSGIDILKALNAETYRAPIFVVSGDRDVADLVRIVLAPAEQPELVA